jgi:GAF domain-containing protein
LGTFALYSHESRVPTEEDLALIQGAARIALIAIERQRAQAALAKAREELEADVTGFVCWSKSKKRWSQILICEVC